MDVREYLSDDGQVILALCSAFGLKEDSEAGGVEVFKLAEWNQLARQIHQSSLKTPAGLQGCDAERLAKELSVASDQAERIVRLLDRSGRLALELEGLFSRGMWAVTRVDALYPKRLRESLKHQAPTVLFGAGEVHLLRRPGIAVIGSRNIDEAGAAFAKEIGRKTAAIRLPVVSGGARGTDRIAMDGAMEAGGTAVGALADSLEATIRKSDVRGLLLDARLVLLTAFAPNAGFSVGAAMGRNKMIYGLAEYAVVVSSDFKTGGTWAGAAEALKTGCCPVFVRDGPNVPKGNSELLKLGASPLPESAVQQMADVAEWMGLNTKRTISEPDLFDSVASQRPGKS